MAFDVFRFKYDHFNEGFELKVLHDWDHVERSGSLSLRRGISLIFYAMARKLPLLNGIQAIKTNTLKIEREQIQYMETVIKLDLIAGVIPIFGIRDKIRLRHGKRIDELQVIYGVDVRRHTHIGDNKDPDRKRLWEPPLNKQTRNSWHFGFDYLRGIKRVLQPGELPIFHIGEPDHISVYIDYLFEEMIKK